MWKFLFFTTFIAFTAAQCRDPELCRNYEDNLPLNTESTNVATCNNYRGDLPLNTHVEECVDPPCLFYQLGYAVVNMVFKAPATIRRMRSLVTAYLSVGPITLPVPYDLEEAAETCNFLTNTYCPILEGEIVVYALRMYIDPLFPVGTRANLEFRVADDNNQPFICIRVGMEVMPPRNTREITNSTNNVH